MKKTTKHSDITGLLISADGKLFKIKTTWTWIVETKNIEIKKPRKKKK